MKNLLDIHEQSLSTLSTVTVLVDTLHGAVNKMGIAPSDRPMSPPNSGIADESGDQGLIPNIDDSQQLILQQLNMLEDLVYRIYSCVSPAPPNKGYANTTSVKEV